MTAASAPEAILARCRAAGVSVEACGDRLRLTPAERVTLELAASVRAFKPRILAYLTWDEQAARALLDATLDRIGRACTDLAGFDTDQVRVDLEERINVAGYRRDWVAYVAVVDDYEVHCLRACGGADGTADGAFG